MMDGLLEDDYLITIIMRGLSHDCEMDTGRNIIILQKEEVTELIIKYVLIMILMMMRLRNMFMKLCLTS